MFLQIQWILAARCSVFCCYFCQHVSHTWRWLSSVKSFPRITTTRPWRGSVLWQHMSMDCVFLYVQHIHDNTTNTCVHMNFWKFLQQLIHWYTQVYFCPLISVQFYIHVISNLWCSMSFHTSRCVPKHVFSTMWQANFWRVTHQWVARWSFVRGRPCQVGDG